MEYFLLTSSWLSCLQGILTNTLEIFHALIQPSPRKFLLIRNLNSVSRINITALSIKPSISVPWSIWAALKIKSLRCPFISLARLWITFCGCVIFLFFRQLSSAVSTPFELFASPLHPTPHVGLPWWRRWLKAGCESQADCLSHLLQSEPPLSSFCLSVS